MPQNTSLSQPLPMPPSLITTTSRTTVCQRGTEVTGEYYAGPDGAYKASPRQPGNATDMIDMYVRDTSSWQEPMVPVTAPGWKIQR